MEPRTGAAVGSSDRAGRNAARLGKPAVARTRQSRGSAYEDQHDKERTRIRDPTQKSLRKREFAGGSHFLPERGSSPTAQAPGARAGRDAARLGKPAVAPTRGGQGCPRGGWSARAVGTASGFRVGRNREANAEVFAEEGVWGRKPLSPRKGFLPHSPSPRGACRTRCDTAGQASRGTNEAKPWIRLRRPPRQGEDTNQRPHDPGPHSRRPCALDWTPAWGVVRTWGRSTGPGRRSPRVSTRAAVGVTVQPAHRGGTASSAAPRLARFLTRFFRVSVRGERVRGGALLPHQSSWTRRAWLKPQEAKPRRARWGSPAVAASGKEKSSRSARAEPELKRDGRHAPQDGPARLRLRAGARPPRSGRPCRLE